MSAQGNEPTAEELRARIAELERQLRARDDQDRARADLRASAAGWLGWFALRVLAGRNLHEDARKLWDGWSAWTGGGFAGPWPERQTRDFTASLLHRFTRIGVVAILLALLPSAFLIVQTVLLSQQNRLLSGQLEMVAHQNRLFDAQNRLTEAQNQLTEATRKSALIFELSGILDRIGDEAKAAGSTPATTQPSTQPLMGQPTGPPVRLSQHLEGRVIALSRSLRPYRYLLSDGQLSARPTSPERGQLLLSLIASTIDLQRIGPEGDFTNADLAGATLKWANLSGVDLRGGVFLNARLRWVKMQRCRVDGCDFSGAEIYDSEFRGCNLRGATFWDATIGRVRFVPSAPGEGYAAMGTLMPDAEAMKGTRLFNCDLNGAIVPGEQWLTGVLAGIRNAETWETRGKSWAVRSVNAADLAGGGVDVNKANWAHFFFQTAGSLEEVRQMASYKGDMAVPDRFWMVRQVNPDGSVTSLPLGDAATK